MLFENVADLSEDEGAAKPPPPQIRCARTGPKRKRKLSPAKDGKSLMARAPTVLARKCGCNAGFCCSKFLDAGKWAEYREYLLHWSGLAKLDQDRIVSGWHFSFVSRVLNLCFFMCSFCSVQRTELVVCVLGFVLKFEPIADPPPAGGF